MLTRTGTVFTVFFLLGCASTEPTDAFDGDRVDGATGAENPDTSTSGREAGPELRRDAGPHDPDVTGDAGPDDPDVRDASISSEASSPDSGGTTPASPECDALEVCCKAIGEPGTHSGCRSVVDLDMNDLCRRIHGDYQSMGWCSEGTSCATLAACCPSLMPSDGWRPTCERTTRDNNETQCARVLGGYQMGGYCR